MTTEELVDLVRSAERSIFRLEALDRYTVAEEDEGYLRWSRGEAPPGIEGDPWFDGVVRVATTAGKRWERVHMLRLPLTDYLRFELEYEYRQLELAGDRCHILEVAQGGPWPVPPVDFWLLDERVVVRMDYDSEGRVLDRVSVADPAAVEDFTRRRETALSLATRFPDWWQRVEAAGRI